MPPRLWVGEHLARPRASPGSQSKKLAEEILKTGNVAIREWQRTHYGVQIDLQAVSFRCARLSGVDFSGSSLEDADFTGANLTDALFIDADADGIRFDYATCVRTIFRGASLRCAYFSDTNCEDADFDRAVLVNAQFQGTILHHASIVSANLNGAVLARATIDGLKATNELRTAYYLGQTVGTPQTMDPDTLNFLYREREKEAVRSAITSS